jgi:CBS domain-containing protein
MRVEKWMTPRVVTIGPDDSLAAAIRLMKEKKVRRLPVV